MPDYTPKLSLEVSTEKPSMSELPNWQIYYKELYEENEKLRSKDEK